MRLLLLVFLVASSASLGIFSAPVAHAQQYNLRLNLSIAPSVVPADSGTCAIYVYLTDSSGAPAAAPSSLGISLYSSDQRIGSVQATATIPQDGYSVSVTFTSTSTPGTTTVTALAQGLQSGSLVVNTQTPVGFPSRLVVFALPPSLIPGGGETGQLVVQLQDAIGNPARAPLALSVQLSSSDTNVVYVPSSLVIPQGNTYATATYTPTTIPGTVIVSATASGYQSGATNVIVSGPSPTRLVMYVLATVLPTDGQSSVPVAIALQDDSGFPALARSNVQVVLTSSNLAIASFASTTVSILQGTMYTMTTLSCGSVGGTVQLTAQSQGLYKSVVSTTGVAPILATNGNISLSLGPSVVLPDGASYSDIVVAQLGVLGNGTFIPMKVSGTGSVQVYFSSSDSIYGSVTSEVTILSGGNYASANFTSTLYVGSTTLTAAANGYSEDQKTMASSAPPPASIVVGAATQVLRATGDSYPVLYVQLQDSEGNPAKAPQPIQVLLSVDNPAAGDVDTFVIIQKGASYAVATFHSTSSPGSVNITASATGFSPAWYVVQTVEPFPSVLAVYVPPGQFFNDGGSYQVFVQLLDAQGRPAKPELPVQIFLTSDNPSVASVAESLTLGSGKSFASTALSLGQGTGDAVITAIAQGFTAGTATVDLVTAPATLSVSLASSSVTVGNSYAVSLSLYSGPAPVSGATITGSAVTGRFSSATGTTGNDGKLGMQYTPLVPGTDNLTFVATKVGFATSTSTITVSVNAYYTVTVSLIDESGVGLAGANVNLTNSKGVSTSQLTDGSGNAVFTGVTWGQTSVSVPALIQGGTTQYHFASLVNSTSTSASFYLAADTTLTGSYQTYFYVTGSSPYGSVTGSEWYLKGGTATFTVSPTSVSSGFLMSKRFSSWAGAATGTHPSISFVVNGPGSVTAKWGSDFTLLYIFVAIIAVVVVAAVGLFWFIRKRRASTTEPQKEEEFT